MRTHMNVLVIFPLASDDYSSLCAHTPCRLAQSSRGDVKKMIKLKYRPLNILFLLNSKGKLLISVSSKLFSVHD